jgi:hypothetical protein
MQRWFVLSSRRQKSDWWCLYAWCLNEFRFDLVSISDINLVFLVDAVQRENQKLALKLIGMNCWHGQHTLKGMLKSHRFQWHLLQILVEHPDFMVKLCETHDRQVGRKRPSKKRVPACLTCATFDPVSDLGATGHFVDHPTEGWPSTGFDPFWGCSRKLMRLEAR